MQSVDGTQCLNITPLFLLSFSIDVFICTAALPAGGPTCPVIVVVPFTSIYASQKSNKLDFKIVALNLIWLLML